jgi:hypothetical protein
MDGNKAQEGSSRLSCVRRPSFRSLVFPFFDLLAENLAVAGVHDDLVELAVAACDLDLEDDEAALVLQLDLPHRAVDRDQGGLLGRCPVYPGEILKAPGLSGLGLLFGGLAARGLDAPRGRGYRAVLERGLFFRGLLGGDGRPRRAPQ